MLTEHDQTLLQKMGMTEQELEARAAEYESGTWNAADLGPVVYNLDALRRSPYGTELGQNLRLSATS